MHSNVIKHCTCKCVWPRKLSINNKENKERRNLSWHIETWADTHKEKSRRQLKNWRKKWQKKYKANTIYDTLGLISQFCNENLYLGKLSLAQSRKRLENSNLRSYFIVNNYIHKPPISVYIANSSVLKYAHMESEFQSSYLNPWSHSWGGLSFSYWNYCHVCFAEDNISY